MSRVNDTGRDVVTFYGPTLVLRATQFVDDVTGAGSPRAINNTIYNCNILEESKKMTFNNGNGKTEYTITNPSKKTEAITSEVKKGKIERSKEHKALGMWIDERGTFMINIEKMKGKVPHMIQTVRAIGSSGNLGYLAIEARMKLVNTVIMPSILYSIEVVPNLSNEEIKKLEMTQKEVLTRLLEVPKSTPYMGILMETGMWTMEARVAYRKLMLLHNLKHSDDERVTKQIVRVQEEEEREGTWISGVQRLIKKYEIKKDVMKVLKSEWKKEVKENIHKKVEEEIRSQCKSMSKTRTIKNDQYRLKTYLRETTVTNAKEILKTRLHMTELTCNFGHSRNSTCPLCGEESEWDRIGTEHYFQQCKATKNMAEIWNVKKEDLSSDTTKRLMKAKNHLKNVEVLMKPYMTIWNCWNRRSEGKDDEKKEEKK